jgi:hypothetical protein
MNEKTDALNKWREEHPEGAGPPRNPWQRWQDHDTRKTAIEAFCWHCMGGTATDGTGVRENIRTCASGPDSEVPCPLHGWRPYK